MEQAEVFNRVQDIFREVFGMPDLQISSETAPADIHDWDSLNHVLLISKIEKQFAIKFSLDNMLAFENVGDICSGVLNKQPK